MSVSLVVKKEDLCHLNNADLARDLQKYRGRVVLRGNNVKDEGGYRAVFAGQGASGRADGRGTVLEQYVKNSGMTGEASDAVSEYAQVKMVNASTLLKLLEKECPEFWIRMPPPRRPKARNSVDDLVVRLERHLYGHPLAGSSMGKEIRTSAIQGRMGESTNMAMSARAQKA